MDESTRHGSPRGTYAKGVRRRKEILDRAIEVFAERGAEGTSLRSIGAALGVSHAALRHYFASREELLVEVYRWAEERLSTDDPVPEGTSVVGAMTHAARRNHGVPGLVQLYSSLVASALEEGHPEARQFAVTRFAALREGMASEIRAEQEAGRIRSDLPPEAVAALIIAASDGMQIQWLLDSAVDIEQSIELLEGLLRIPEPAQPRDDPSPEAADE